jgi:hypothetical protein
MATFKMIRENHKKDQAVRDRELEQERKLRSHD